MSEQSDARSLQYTVPRRLQLDGRWHEAQIQRDQLIREARQTGMALPEAREWAYAMLDDLFPPLQGNPQNSGKNSGNRAGNMGIHMGQGEVGNTSSDVDVTSQSQARAREGESPIVGLGEIPADWPKLPPNASLSTEIQWVVANRLGCVDESSQQVVVDLSQALTPAPSYAALGWLETSIRAYTKFVDVAAKVTSTQQDDQDVIRRERLSIAEIRSLLAEMIEERDAATPPAGRDE